MRVAGDLPAVTTADVGRNHDSGPVDATGFELLLAHESARHGDGPRNQPVRTDGPRRDDALAPARRRDRDPDHRPTRAAAETTDAPSAHAGGAGPASSAAAEHGATPGAPADTSAAARDDGSDDGSDAGAAEGAAAGTGDPSVTGVETAGPGTAARGAPEPGGGPNPDATTTAPASSAPVDAATGPEALAGTPAAPSAMPISPATTTEIATEIVTEIVTETGTPPGSPAGLETESEPPSDAAPAAGAVAPGRATPGRDAIASTTGPATTAGRTRAATTRGAGATTDPAGAREPGSSAPGPAPAPADPDARSASRGTGPPASGATDLHGRDPRATTPNSDHATGATSASSAPSGPAPAVTASTSAVDAAAAAPVATGAATGVATAAPASTGSSVPTPPAPATLPPYVQVVAAALPLRTQGDGSHRITMQLAPPELGRVEVEVHVQAGEVRVHLRADEAAAGALLHESIAELRRSLETQGLRVVDVAVDTRAHDHDDPGTHRRGLDESPLGGAPDDRSPTDDDVARRNARTAPEPVDATGGLHLLDLHI